MLSTFNYNNFYENDHEHIEGVMLGDLIPGAVYQLVRAGGADLKNADADLGPIRQDASDEFDELAWDTGGEAINWIRTSSETLGDEKRKPRISCVRLDTGELRDLPDDLEVFRVEYR